MRGSLQHLVYRRQILMSKVDPRTERVNDIYNWRKPITYTLNNIGSPGVAW